VITMDLVIPKSSSVPQSSPSEDQPSNHARSKRHKLLFLDITCPSTWVVPTVSL
jgi:hypothetical protein